MPKPVPTACSTMDATIEDEKAERQAGANAVVAAVDSTSTNTGESEREEQEQEQQEKIATWSADNEVQPLADTDDDGAYIMAEMCGAISRKAEEIVTAPLDFSQTDNINVNSTALDEEAGRESSYVTAPAHNHEDGESWEVINAPWEGAADAGEVSADSQSPSSIVGSKEDSDTYVVEVEHEGDDVNGNASGKPQIGSRFVCPPIDIELLLAIHEPAAATHCTSIQAGVFGATILQLSCCSSVS